MGIPIILSYELRLSGISFIKLLLKSLKSVISEIELLNDQNFLYWQKPIQLFLSSLI